MFRWAAAALSEEQEEEEEDEVEVVEEWAGPRWNVQL